MTKTGSPPLRDRVAGGGSFFYWLFIHGRCVSLHEDRSGHSRQKEGPSSIFTGGISGARVPRLETRELALRLKSANHPGKEKKRLMLIYGLVHFISDPFSQLSNKSILKNS
ncbi:hypothetical protein CEXT_746581 [Caerostris extrusa]|uniref:Uncharacterized protein n=1 Tax=Caerostris extrusa TaxID=172846 RepID=A0AAV4VDY4_CAEEX|nr:hypothetical protein CEXT_746581 [Caerostris extrusa]